MKYTARDLYLFCRSTYEIEQMRDYAQRHFDKDKSDYNMQGFFMTISADCIRYREILDRLGVSKQLIKIEGEDIILDLQKQIESLKAITELAVKGLKEVLEDAPWESVSYGVAFEALREIDRLSHETNLP